MSIASTDERLSAYLDGDLMAEELAALEHELAHDAQLRAELDALRLVVRTLRDEGPVRAPLGFHVAVMDRIEEEHPQASWWRRALQRPLGIPAQGWAVVLAAAAVLLVVQLGREDGGAEADRGGPVWRDTPAEALTAPAAMKGPMRQERVAEEGAPKGAQAPLPGPPGEGGGGAPGAVEAEAAEPAAVASPGADGEPGEGRGGDAHPVESVLRTPPSGLTLRTRDPAALREVLALVARFGGTVTTPSGEAVAHATLQSAVESVVVRIPSEQLASFQEALEGLGSVHTAFDTERLYAGPTLEVPLTFKLVGGSSGTSEAPATPAARQERGALQLDEVDELE